MHIKRYLFLSISFSLLAVNSLAQSHAQYNPQIVRHFVQRSIFDDIKPLFYQELNLQRASFLSNNHKALNRTTQSLDQQARLQANSFWAGKIIRCGESHFTRHGGLMLEFKGMNILLTADPLSQADRLNGISWRGRTQITATSSRIFSSASTSQFNAGWSQWNEGISLPLSLIARLVRQNGKWDFASSDFSSVKELTAISCEDARNPYRFYQQLKSQAEAKKLEQRRQNAPARGIYTGNIPPAMFNAIYEAVDHGNYRQSAFAPNGGWIVVNKLFGFKYSGLPAAATAILDDFTRQRGYNIAQAAISSKNGWILIYGLNDKGWHSEGISKSLLDRLQELHKEDQLRTKNEIRLITFPRGDGWVMVYGDNAVSADDVPNTAWEKIVELSNGGERIRAIAFTPSLGWVIVHGRNGWSTYGDVPQEVIDAMQELHDKDWSINTVTFGWNGEWIVTGSRY